MELLIVEDYQNLFPPLKGSALTDRLILEAVEDAGYGKGSAIKVRRTEKGKPFLSGGQTELPQISVSHSGTFFVCLMGDRPLGVDIQEERPVNAAKIAERYFSPEENQYLANTGSKGFFTLWTRKEAYAKYKGTGLEELLKGTAVLGRRDVDFFDVQLEKGLYCSCCMKKEIK